MSTHSDGLWVNHGEHRYPIHIGAGLRADGARLRAALHGRQVLVISNTTVAALHLPPLRAILADLPTSEFLLPDGEVHKTFAQVGHALAALARLGATRDATVIALGGGVVGDLAGLTAALWMRGVAVIQIPTTLLAMVDSSVGGKTGVNLPEGKNLVGAFHPPQAVFIDPEYLGTLPARELAAGLAEVVKTAAIRDTDFFAWLEENASALLDRQPAALHHAIARSVKHKAEVVAADPLERGQRALLNLGHSFGHAIEALTGYTRVLHGEAVAIGLVAAADLSVRLGIGNPADIPRLVRLLQDFRLPSAIPADLSAKALYQAMTLDKKVLAGRMRLILLRGIGHAEIVDDATEPMILATLWACGADR